MITASGSGDGGDTEIEGKAAVAHSSRGIPQQGMVLGDPKAPVELIEFGDLQCPVCAAYAEEILPEIMETQVKKGEVKIDFRNFTIIGPESIAAGAAALAAGAQGRGWNFIELFYRNQGDENSGYADDDPFLKALARTAGVQNRSVKWDARTSRNDRRSRRNCPRSREPRLQRHAFLRDQRPKDGWDQAAGLPRIGRRAGSRNRRSRLSPTQSFLPELT